MYEVLSEVLDKFCIVNCFRFVLCGLDFVDGEVKLIRLNFFVVVFILVIEYFGEGSGSIRVFNF